MLTFILLCVASAFVITLLFDQFQDFDSPIGWIPLYLNNFFVKYKILFLSKPLYDCMICMSSFWGSIYFWVLSRLFAPEYGLLEIVCAVPVIGGMLTLISVYYFMKEISGEEDGTTYI